MSDHISGPRAIADPVTDITDVYAFPCPESPRHLVLVMNVFPYAGPAVVFSDAVIYRLRVRSASIAPDGRGFNVGAEEFTVRLHIRCSRQCGQRCAAGAAGPLHDAKRRGRPICRERREAAAQGRACRFLPDRGPIRFFWMAR